jgi:hypothetical protein
LVKIAIYIDVTNTTFQLSKQRWYKKVIIFQPRNKTWEQPFADQLAELTSKLVGPPGLPGRGKPGRLGPPGQQGQPGLKI